MLKQKVSIIIPTYQNYEQLLACMSSILRYSAVYPVEIIVVNNGGPELHQTNIDTYPNTLILDPPHNLGWEGGLKLGLEHSDSEFVIFMNDDTFVPESSKNWLLDMLQTMCDPRVGAVGPITNVVMGSQQMFYEPSPRIDDREYLAPFLIGFCVMFRRSALDKIGGVDDTLPGGDDLDYSIRLHKNGYLLVVNRKVFIYHHGFQVGTRLHGGPDRPGGWNSKEMSTNTNIGLIRKHGLKEWFNCLYGQIDYPETESKDIEGDFIRKHIGSEKIIELGVGGNKTSEKVVGVDMVPKGEAINLLDHQVSVADVVADVTEKLPFKDKEFDTLIARHILEHVVDPISALKEWIRIVKPKGKLIFALPDEKTNSTIPMNPEHKHAYTLESFKRLVELVGLKVIKTKENFNTVSFIVVCEKEVM